MKEMITRDFAVVDRPGLNVRVFLRDMELMASVGVHETELATRQRIRINIELMVEAKARMSPGVGVQPRSSAEIERVVDYAAVADRVRALVARGHVSLLEDLSERIADVCLADPRVRMTRVRVEKPDIFEDIGSVGVEIERFRQDYPQL